MKTNISSFLKTVFLLFMCVAMTACINKRKITPYVPVYHEPDHCEALRFIESKHYYYSKSKKTIPGIVRFGIAEFEGSSDFYVGAYVDSDQINLTDALTPIFNGVYSKEYRRRLNFVVKNDSFCLISYTEGGYGESDITYFIQYLGGFRLLRYNYGVDTSSLASYLLYNPNPDTTWRRPD